MKKNVVVFCLLLIFGVMMLGCGKSDEKIILPPIEYGNGVYYFKCLGTDFTESLSAFIGSHPDLEIVTMVGDGAGNNGYNLGFTVVFKEKK